MTSVERAVKALCEAIVRVCGGDVETYRARVNAMRELSEDQMLEQAERQIRFRRRRLRGEDATGGGQ